jgi:hypothetical protein
VAVAVVVSILLGFALAVILIFLTVLTVLIGSMGRGSRKPG